MYRAFRLRFGWTVGIALLTVLIWTPTSRADDTVPYRHYTVRDGLPHETIHSLAQGPDERLWIGTAAGLAVYDGHSIRRVRLPDSLATTRVLDLLTCPSGATWAALSGEALIRLRGGTITRVVPLPATTNSPVRLLARRDTVMAVMRKGLWMLPPGTERVVKRPYDYPIQTGALAKLGRPQASESPAAPSPPTARSGCSTNGAGSGACRSTARSHSSTRPTRREIETGG